MSLHILKDKYYVFKGEKNSEEIYRSELSKLIIEKFGKGPFHDQTKVREIVVYSLDYYILKFKELCLKEKSLTFYQNILWFHEQATEIAGLYPHQDLSEDISEKYIVKYRRILKFILEMGCDVSMASGEEANQIFHERMQPILHNLMFLGEMILMCVDLYATQTMIDDVADITFDNEEQYIFSRRHHYEKIFEYIIKEQGSRLSKSVVDENGFEHLEIALQNCFGIKYEEVGHLIASIHEQNEAKGGEMVGVGWETLPLNLQNLFGVPLEIAEQFFQGLRLDKTSKMDLLDLACRPYKLNRYLYKPIIVWSVDGNDFAFFGKNSWTEAFIQLATNAIPWGKAPEHWMKNDCFKKYVHGKEDEHDKWLDDAVEEKLKHQKILYDRNVTQLKITSGNVNIDVKGLGEVDFILIVEKIKKIYISDCKHLLGRYDLPNQKNDYNSFAVGSKKNKSYNQTMSDKLTWFSQNKDLVQQHFRIKYNLPSLSLEDYSFEGIFIVNTPTIYMYNAKYRIYPIDKIEEVFSGDFTDPTFMIVIDDGEYEKILNVKYPYFQKPKYTNIDPFKDDESEDE